MSVTSFTPQKNYPSFSGQVIEGYGNPAGTIPNYGTAGAVTYTAADLLGGFITRNCNGASRSDVMPTAASLIPLIQGAMVGSAIQVIIKNTSAAAYTITLTAGTGVTLNVGDTMTIAQSNQKTFLLMVTALPDQYGNGGAYTVFSLGTVVF